MRFLTALVLSGAVVSSPVVSAAEDSLWETVSEPAFGLWSGAVVAKDSLYKDVDVQVSPSLLIFGGYGDVFIEANRFGYGIYRDGTNFASVVGNVRSYTTLTEDQIEDSRTLSEYDLDERKTALEVGVQVGRRLGGGWVSRAALLQDISGAHKAQEAELLFYRRDDIAGFRILTTIGGQYQSEKLNDYYFGVDADEITNSATQEIYKPGSGWSAELEVIATYDFEWGADNNWGAYGGFRHFQYGSEAKDSPLVDDGLVQQFFLGIGKYF